MLPSGGHCAISPPLPPGLIPRTEGLYKWLEYLALRTFHDLLELPRLAVTYTGHRNPGLVPQFYVLRSGYLYIQTSLCQPLPHTQIDPLLCLRPGCALRLGCCLFLCAPIQVLPIHLQSHGKSLVSISWEKEEILASALLWCINISGSSVCTVRCHRDSDCYYLGWCLQWE
jgi:hypothetical protein